jgi:two-component system chemotaxis sensor kinase CheA
MDEAVRLLLLGGISTSGEVSDVSGRGIGMDAVRETVNRLRGSIRIDSAPESGTRVEIQVPYSMTTFPALAVEAGGSPFLIPFDAVRKAVRIVEKDVARSPEGDTILFEDRTIPLLPLEEVFSGRPEKLRRARPAVAVDSPAGSAMVCVDRILGVRQAVARPLPSLAPSDETVGGASMDAEGNPCLVMDPEGLVRYAQGRRGGRHEGKSSAKPIVLIVDDSLTTRMLEQSILESAGYRVETAVSAEDALELARGKRYGLFLVDVEMPGMDGFMLLEKFREDAGLRDIPSILVTSRSSREDRNRAESKGARDYIVQGEFDQARLLGRIKELIG